MKKRLLAVMSLISITCFSQTTGHLRFDTVRIYKVGGNSTLAIENDTRDSLGFLYNYGNGRTRFEVIRAVAGGIKVGDDTIIVNTSCEDGVVFGRTVTWEGGFRFHVQEGVVSIDCQLYALDSITLTLDSSDADDRFDVIYDDVDGAHVLEGTPATPANIPQVTGEQIHLTAILIEAGALNPSVSSINVYFENDATITPSGTTAVGNSTVVPFAGTFHIRITTINNGDFVDIIKPSGTWDISDQDALVIHIKNRAVVPQLANLRVSLWNGASTGSQVSNEIILAYNKNLTSGYQAIAIPMANFNVQNTNIDRVRLRFTSNNANNFTGYDIDNVFFEDGVPQPGNNGTGQFTLNVPAFLTLTPSNTIVTNNTTYTLSATGNTSQYVRGDGSLATFTAVTAVGAFNTATPNSNGAEIIGTDIFFHPVSATVNGMVTPAFKQKWDSIYYAENMSLLGDSIMVSIAVDRIGFKSLVEGSGITITPTDSTLVIASAGGSGGRFGVAGEDDVATQNRVFDTDGNILQIVGEGDKQIESETTTGYVNTIRFDDSENLTIKSVLGGNFSGISLLGDQLAFSSSAGIYLFTNLFDQPTYTKVIVYDAAGDNIGTQDISGLGGGGGSPFLPVTGTGTATGNIVGELGGNSLIIENGTNTYFRLDPTAGSENASIGTINTTAGDNQSYLSITNSNTQSGFVLQADFDAASQVANITGNALSGISTLAYSAEDGHTFQGDVLTSANNTYDIGNTTNSFKDGYFRRILLDGSTSGTIEIASGPLAIVALGTNLSGAGYVPFVQSIIVRADETLSNSSADQNLFTNTAHDVITVQANTTYEFYITGDLTHGAVSHSIALGFTPTTAVVSSIEYNAYAWVTAVGTATASQVSTRVKATATSIINLAGANAVETFEARGTITIGATGGTITPQIKFSADPTGTILLKAGARMHIWAIGNNTFTQQGNIN